MNEREFNEYCAKVMGYLTHDDTVPDEHGGLIVQTEYAYSVIYNPYDDLNQMAEVFDKLMSDSNFILMKFMTYDCSHTPPLRIDIPIKDAMRDFIISTMEKDNE